MSASAAAAAADLGPFQPAPPVLTDFDRKVTYKEDSGHGRPRTYTDMNGDLHHPSLPAFSYREEGKYRAYFWHGKKHRDGDLPAESQALDYYWEERWYRFGHLHRAGDKPAIQHKLKKKWYRYGFLHRSGDKPAVDTWAETEWYWYGVLHRDGDKPARIFFGRRYWYQFGKLHRDNGPAVIYENGTKKYYRHGVLHRDDGPAVVRKNGVCEYWIDGKRHRDDGPAIEGPYGHRYDTWYCYGEIHCETGLAKYSRCPAWDQHGKPFDSRTGWYYLNGKVCQNREDFERKLAELQRSRGSWTGRCIVNAVQLVSSIAPFHNSVLPSAASQLSAFRYRCV